jgi:hypothetical protein
VAWVCWAEHARAALGLQRFKWFLHLVCLFLSVVNTWLLNSSFLFKNQELIAILLFPSNPLKVSSRNEGHLASSRTNTPPWHGHVKPKKFSQPTFLKLHLNFKKFIPEPWRRIRQRVFCIHR